MTTFFTSDLHFGHRRIIELCGRPFADVEEMNREIIARINETCKPGDTLWVLGDVIMGGFDENIKLLDQLNVEQRRRVMVTGNHDRTSLAYKHRGNPAEKREYYRRQYRRYFDQVRLDDRVHFVNLQGTRFAVSHYPYEGDSQENDRHSELRPVDEGLPLLHGHVHGAWREWGRQFNVGVDVNDFKPVHEDELVAWARSLM